jgi:hypothetical protein
MTANTQTIHIERPPDDSRSLVIETSFPNPDLAAAAKP